MGFLPRNFKYDGGGAAWAPPTVALWVDPINFQRQVPAGSPCIAQHGCPLSSKSAPIVVADRRVQLPQMFGLTGHLSKVWSRRGPALHSRGLYVCACNVYADPCAA